MGSLLSVFNKLGMFITRCDCSKAIDDKDHIQNYTAQKITVVNITIDMNELDKLSKQKEKDLIDEIIKDEKPPRYSIV
jgi:hypothetical protein